MRIGLFSSDYPFKAEFAAGEGPALQWGGVAEVVYQISKALNDQGHEVKVFTTSPTRTYMVQRFENIEVHRYGKDWQVASTALSLDLLRKPLKYDLDLVHGHLGTPPGAYAASYYSRRKGRPFVLTIHTPYSEVSMEGGTLAKRLALRLFMDRFCQPLLRKADALTSVSRAVMDESPYYRSFIPMADIIPNGVDMAGLAVPESREECRGGLGIPPGARMVLFVGSLSPYKNPELLLEAFAGLDPGRQDACLAMVGDGPLRGRLTEIAEQRGLRDRVLLPGFVTEADKRRYYKAADLLALPSLAEAFPLVLLEAAAFGLPLVVSDIDVFRAVVSDGRNGLVFRSGSEEDLRSKLAALLGDDTMREEVGRNARAFAEEHDWKRIMERYGRIYQGLVP